MKHETKMTTGDYVAKWQTEEAERAETKKTGATCGPFVARGRRILVKGAAVEIEIATANPEFENAAANAQLLAASWDMAEVLKRLYDAMMAGHSINPYEYRAVTGDALRKAGRL